jgi:hypothetical protein
MPYYYDMSIFRRFQRGRRKKELQLQQHLDQQHSEEKEQGSNPLR